MILFLAEIQAMNTTMCSVEQTGYDERVGQAITKLCSADNSVRERGRVEVLQIGSAAAGALVNLLSDLIQDPRPRFVTEKEEEGRKALDEYEDLIQRKKHPIDDCKEYQTVDSLAINARLISDAISLLGELKAVEGVPILIRIMENRDTGVSEPTGVELEALRKIGLPAVPSLIKSIEDAHVNAARLQPPIIFGYVISFGSEDDLDNTEDEDWEDERDGQPMLDPETKREIETKTFRIKRKAIRVLGEIGDKSVLPFLQSLAKTESNQTLTLLPSVLGAIRDIRNETASGFGPLSRKP